MLSTLRRLFSYLEEHCLVFDNPARHLQSPRIKRTLPDVISVDQIKRLLAIPDCTTVLGLRNRAALELAYTTGMRSSELALLTLLDIDFTNATVRVFGKGQKERILPLGTSAVRYSKTTCEPPAQNLFNAVINPIVPPYGSHTPVSPFPVLLPSSASSVGTQKRRNSTSQSALIPYALAVPPTYCKTALIPP